MIRIGIFVVCYVVGYDVWIVPNLLNDKMSFLESLSPIIAYWPRDDDKLTIGFRVFISVSFLLACVHWYMHPESLYEMWGILTNFSNDSYDWISYKITSYHVSDIKF
jgi:hypothetical protein